MREEPFGCAAKSHARLSLFDYATGGMGWGYTPMENGKPCMRYADTLDVLWDQTSRLPQNIQWWSVTVCMPLYYWANKFGAAKI